MASSGRIYVGGASVKEQGLQQLFGKYGKIINTMVRAEYSFVELEDKRDADRAIKDLDGVTWEGRKLRVEAANSRKDPADKGNCFACGKSGHWSRECPTSSSRDKKACFNCGKVGHMAKECKSAKVERRDRGRDRDRDRDYDYDRRRDDRYGRDPPYRGRDDFRGPPRAPYYDDPRGPPPPPPSYRDDYPRRDEPYAERYSGSYGGRGRSRSPPPPPPPPPPRYGGTPRPRSRSPPPPYRGRSPVRSPPRGYPSRGPSPGRSAYPENPRPYSPVRDYRGAPGYPEPVRNGAYGRY